MALESSPRSPYRPSQCGQMSDFHNRKPIGIFSEIW